MIVYGGGTAQPFDSDVWVLDASKYPTLSWERKDMSNKDQGPGTRMGTLFFFFVFFLSIVIVIFPTNSFYYYIVFLLFGESNEKN